MKRSLRPCYKPGERYPNTSETVECGKIRIEVVLERKPDFMHTTCCELRLVEPYGALCNFEACNSISVDQVVVTRLVNQSIQFN